MVEVTVTKSTQRRITTTLFACQSFFGATTILAFTLMAVIGSRLSGSDSAAGVPPTMMLLGRALAAYPVGWMMDKVGRRLGLSLGYLLGVLGGMISMVSVDQESFWGFCLGVSFLGMARGVTEQVRFVAAEVHPVDRRAKMIGLIVFAGTIGSVGGPLLVGPSGKLGMVYGLAEFAGPYLLGAIFSGLALLLSFSFLRPDPLDIGRCLSAGKAESITEIPTRALRDIFSGGMVRLAILSLVIGQLVMTLLMVITPLHMDHHHHGTHEISLVIMSHTLGMYGLASVTGWLVDRYGRIFMVVVGALILVVSAILTPVSVGVPMIAVALFLLGLGWNFCFIAGSSLLTNSLGSEERGRAQGASEMLVALGAGAGSLGTGIMFTAGGIMGVSGFGLLLSLVLIGAVIYYRSSGSNVTPAIAEAGD
ncbi:MAG: MFS transporter [Gemmatimonadetes bacterium]|nr:MFS transporter [Gemmatimonadota bacterium]